LNVCSIVIVLFLSTGLGERGNYAMDLLQMQPESNFQAMKNRVLATDLIEFEAQASLLTCSSSKPSPCSGIGPSSVIIQPGATTSFTTQLSCTANYVFASWSLPYGVTINVNFVGTNPEVELYASSSASGSGTFQSEWCDSHNRHAEIQTAIIVGCGGAVCTSTQSCYVDPSSGTSSCVNTAQEGQSCSASVICESGLACVDSVCVTPRLPCLYNGPSPCAFTVPSSTSFAGDGQNDTFTVGLTATAACTPVTYSYFSSTLTYGVNFYWEFIPNAITFTVNDETEGGSGSVTVEFCDTNSLYAKTTVAFDFNE